jgi:ATP diphosphatase
MSGKSNPEAAKPTPADSDDGSADHLSAGCRGVGPDGSAGLRPDARAAEALPPAGLERLVAIMAALRDPETGCPWDLEQTFATIAPYTVEEAYEVADAIERNDLADLKQELGDLLLQVVYHARIAEEAGAFAFDDVVAAISDKMVRRHPHVFGTAQERAEGAAPGFWERIKAEEKAGLAADRARLGVGEDEARSLLDDVTRTLPALVQAVKLQKKAATVGFDWPSLGPVLAKISEELGELESALAAGDRDAVRAEFGDLLFVLANVARHLDVAPEDALAATNAKFRRRFRRIELWLAEGGCTLEAATLEEMDALWDRAKAEERGSGGGGQQ